MFQFKKVRTMLFFALMIGLLFPAGYGLAQSPTINATINYLSATNSDSGNAVSAYVSILNEGGNSITGLTSDNFTILEDGHAVSIDSVTLATDPMSIILVMDTSGSMAAKQSNGVLALDAAKQASVSFIQSLSAEDQIAVYSFNDDVSKLQDLTIDHNAAINAINGLSWKDFGGTCLYDSAYQAIKKSAEVPQGRRAIILLTDGVDEKSGGKPGEACSVHTLNDVIDEATLSTSKVPIFTIGFGKDVDEQELLRLASRTGGQGIIAPDATTLNDVFLTIANQLKNQYLLTYQTQVASGEHAVVVKVNYQGQETEDERRVFVPVYSNTTIENTDTASTPVSQESSNLSVVIDNVTTEGVLDGELSVQLLLEPAENIARTAIYIDDRQLAEATEAPFDQFILKMADIGPGKHIIRVEATNEAGVTALDKRDLTIPETPAPTVAPTTPPEQPTTSSVSSLPLPLPLLLAIGGAVLLVLIIIIIIIVLIVGNRKRNNGFTPPPTTTEDSDFISAEESYNYKTAIDPFKTMDDGDSGIPGGMPHSVSSSTPMPAARLLVLDGINVLKGDSFPLIREKTVLGRNAGGSMADIDIPDKPVSRLHAEIIFNGQQFTIQDTGSTYGTYVNGNRIGRNAVVLHDKAVVGLGTKTKLRFEIISGRHHSDDPDRTLDGDLDDPFKTSDVI